MNTLYAFTSLPSQLKTRLCNPKYSPNGIRQRYNSKNSTQRLSVLMIFSRFCSIGENALQLASYMALMNTLYAFTSLPSQLKTRQYNPKYSPNGIRQRYMVTGEVYKTLHGAVRQLARQNQVFNSFIVFFNIHWGPLRWGFYQLAGSQAVIKLKADRPNRRYYQYTPTDYRRTEFSKNKTRVQPTYSILQQRTFSIIVYLLR